MPQTHPFSLLPSVQLYDLIICVSLWDSLICSRFYDSKLTVWQSVNTCDLLSYFTLEIHIKLITFFSIFFVKRCQCCARFWLRFVGMQVASRWLLGRQPVRHTWETTGIVFVTDTVCHPTQKNDTVTNLDWEVLKLILSKMSKLRNWKALGKGTSADSACFSCHRISFVNFPEVTVETVSAHKTAAVWEDAFQNN